MGASEQYCKSSTRDFTIGVLVASKWSCYSQQGLDRAIGLQGLCQLLDPVDVGDNAQVKIELGQGVRLRHPPADATEISVRKLTAPEREQFDGVLPQALADIPDLRT